MNGHWKTYESNAISLISDEKGSSTTVQTIKKHEIAQGYEFRLRIDFQDKN